MFASIALDILLILIVLLMAAIGAYRGGLREAFSAAGVVLGVLLAREWSQPWGDWLARNTNLTEGGARFTISVALLLVATAAVGYGVGASFNYHPGPGGRMFGGLLGAGSGVVAASYTLSWVRTDVFGGDEPEVIRDSFIARFLDGNAGLVLLIVSGLLVAASLFGSFVRERDSNAVEAGPGSPSPAGPRRTEAMPDKLEPPQERTHPSTQVQVRPSRQWEDRAGSLPPATDRQWSNTWPSDAPGVPREENPARPGQVQQARERRRGQSRPGGSSESGG